MSPASYSGLPRTLVAALQLLQGGENLQYSSKELYGTHCAELAIPHNPMLGPCSTSAVLSWEFAIAINSKTPSVGCHWSLMRCISTASLQQRASSSADTFSAPLPMQVKCHACVGGTSVREDARILSAGVHVVVGTPGRVFDMLRRRCLRADSIKMFTLDEADEMLSRGFKDQIYDIFQLLPPKLQVGVGFAGCGCLQLLQLSVESSGCKLNQQTLSLFSCIFM